MNLRTIGILLLCCTIFAGVAFVQHLGIKEHGKAIAIIQTASHPALDAVKDGLIEEFKHALPSHRVILHNGQGSIDQLHMMAKSASQNPQVEAIVAIATPAAQAVAHVEREKPIIIAAVTDPQAAGVTQPNVCGILDMIDCTKELQLIKTLVPTAKTMGILCNIGEVNAVSLANSMKELCAKKNITCIQLGIAHENDILQVLEQRLHECDMLWAPLDNSVANSISLIIDKTIQAKKPFFVSDNLLVGKGALAAAGVDYNISGKQAAHIVTDVLSKNQKPTEISFKKPTIDTFWINRSVMKELGFQEPDSSDLTIEWVDLKERT